MSSKVFLKPQAVELRHKGQSLLEISRQLGISKSTASVWVGEIKMNEEAILRLKELNVERSKRGLAKLKIMREEIKNEILNKVKADISEIKLTKELAKLLCAIFFWTEGKKDTTSMGFINSDPIMVSSFLRLFRLGFSINESKFRVLVHIHEYHNDDEIKQFWSKVTNVSLKQFNKSYLKPHTKKSIHPDYKGTISLKYFDYKIALELKMIYNMFAESICNH